MTITASSSMRSSARAPGAEPLNVAYLSPGWPSGRVANGIVSYVGNMLEGLRSQPRASGYVISTTGALPDEPAEDNVIYLPPVPRTRFERLRDRLTRQTDAQSSLRHRSKRIVAAVQQLVREKSLHVFELEESIGFAGRVIPKVPVPVVVRLHGPWFLNGPALGVPQNEGFLARDQQELPGIVNAAVVTGVSKQVLQATREHYEIDLPNAEVIYNPVPPCRAENRWSAQECDLDHILFVGRFDRHKGGDVVIDAFARIAANHPTARLSFAGPDRGCLDDAGKRWLLPEYVSAKLPDPQVRARFEWLDLQTHEQIAKLRQRAAVTVVASRYETFGIAAVEAMAAGCPLVSTDAGGLGEIMADGVNALVAGPGDADDLAVKVLSLLQHRDRAAALGERAMHDAVRFHPDVIAAQSVALYRRTVEQFKRTGRSPSVGR